MKVAVHIREATPSDLPVLHALASSALEYDEFSVDLLAQKLFFNPHPDRDEYTTLIAECDGRPVGLLQYVIRRCEAKAWLGIFVVEADQRRQGIGRQLYDVAADAWRERGVHTVDILTVSTNYLVPGIDERYTSACRFVESLGFVHRATKANMLAMLDRDFDTRAKESKLERIGFTIRRAGSDDAATIEQFFAGIFGEGWLAEVRLAMRQQPPALHLAFVGEEIVAFAAHSTMNQEWGNFGPMGTAEAARGLGLGEMLLYRCMADLKAAGHKTAVIPWVGPDAFYSRLLNCHIARVFRQYRLEQFNP